MQALGATRAGHDLPGQCSSPRRGSKENFENKIAQLLTQAARCGGLFREHGNRPGPVQLRDCPKLKGECTDAEVLHFAESDRCWWPGWLPYRLDADSAEQAIEKAKEQAENHYPEYEKFEVQAIEIERRSK